MGRNCRSLQKLQFLLDLRSQLKHRYQCYSKKNLKNDKLINNLLLRFHNKPPCHANLKRIHNGFQEMKPCRVKNDAKSINSRVLLPVSMGLIYTCIYTVILIRTSSQKSKSRVHYLIFQNNDFAALQDHLKRIYLDSQKMKPCCVKNDTKTVSSSILSPVSMGLICTCI